MCRHLIPTLFVCPSCLRALVRLFLCYIVDFLALPNRCQLQATIVQTLAVPHPTMDWRCLVLTSPHDDIIANVKDMGALVSMSRLAVAQTQLRLWDLFSKFHSAWEPQNGHGLAGLAFFGRIGEAEEVHLA